MAESLYFGDAPALGDFYNQAFNRSVALPVAERTTLSEAQAEIERLRLIVKRTA